MENSLNIILPLVPYDNFGCFPNAEGVYNSAETEYLPLMHVGYCVHYCFSKNYPLASLGGNANRYVDKFNNVNQMRSLVRASAECKCTNAPGNQADADKCDYKCAGDPTDTCGGQDHRSVYGR